MGDAKKRRIASLLAARPVTPGQLLLRRAAEHLWRDWVLPHPLLGACHYLTFALHHHLATAHDVIVPVRAGWVRFDGAAWSMHSWLEADGSKTDLAIHYPNPPAPSGDLLIDGQRKARGKATALYSLAPDDGIPTTIEASKDLASRLRRTKERDMTKRLADSGDLTAILAYLQGDAVLYRRLTTCWSRFTG